MYYFRTILVKPEIIVLKLIITKYRYIEVTKKMEPGSNYLKNEYDKSSSFK